MGFYQESYYSPLVRSYRFVHIRWRLRIFIRVLHSQGKNLQGAVWFCILLNLKHIYLYIAPAYFVYLFRSFCLEKKSRWVIHWKRFFSLGLIVITVFAVSFGPFIAQLDQVLVFQIQIPLTVDSPDWHHRCLADYSLSNADCVMLIGRLISGPCTTRSTSCYLSWVWI